MGLTFGHLAFLAQARASGVRFDELLTIGHQTLYLSPRQARRLAAFTRTKVSGLSSPWGEDYADHFLQEMLATKRLCSLDCSPYEGSEIIHDMNQPIGTDYEAAFDAVIDGGSTEHVFNYPTALANCMRLVKKGGSLFILTMANNHMGHGFYQLSPELFYRALQPCNGFEIRRVALEVRRYPSGYVLPGKFYLVADPMKVGSRIGLVCRKPVQIMVHAVRTDVVVPFARYPIQSDYAAMHVRSQGGVWGPKRRRKWVQRLPLWLREIMIGCYERSMMSFWNRKFYCHWNPLAPTVATASTREVPNDN